MQHVSFTIPQQNIKYNISQNLEVRDVPNHIVRLFDLHGTIPNNAATINGVELAEVFLSGVGDVTNGNVVGFPGYMVFVAQNGDKFYSHSTGVAQIGPSNATTMWNGLITGGTGRFAGIQGFTRQVNTTFDTRSGLSGAAGSPQIDIDYSIGTATASLTSGGTAEEARAMLVKAIAAVKADRDVAISMFQKGEGGFRDRDLYPFCFRLSDGKGVATPVAVSAGTDIRTLKDSTGKDIGTDLYLTAKQKPEGEIFEGVTYRFPKPGTTAPEFTKTSFGVKVADLVCGVGYYK
jgi:hypothetical protein